MRPFPKGMSASTLGERREYYQEEFSLSHVSRWIAQRRGLKFAMIPGRHTHIVSTKHAEDRDNVVVIDDWRTASDIRDYALEYLPEGLYYDRNRYVDAAECMTCNLDCSHCVRCNNYDGQQLAFDLDPENVDCPYHGHIGDKMSRGEGLSFCMHEFKIVRRHSLELAASLRERFNKVSIVYSGRGFHVVVDDEAGYSMPPRRRSVLARAYARVHPIDEWVTVGRSRLMRLPWSLNGIVSRKCMIMKHEKDLLKFDPRTSDVVIPRFRKSS